jgi:hypothetical protein
MLTLEDVQGKLFLLTISVVKLLIRNLFQFLFSVHMNENFDFQF